MTTTNQARVAISQDFFTAFAQVPRAQQKKVADFINKFQSNPFSPGIHYEPIQQARDKNLKSVRIDQDYRGIIHYGGSGNVFLLLWVDAHDQAYAWAMRKQCVVHRQTGTIQVYDVVESQQSLSEETEEEGLFRAISGSKLQQMGVPPEHVAMVQQIQDEQELELRRMELPQEAFEALQFVASGLSAEEVIEELFASGREEAAQVDPEDFHKALDSEGSRQRFLVLDRDKEGELEKMLMAPLEQWRVFLHRSQRKVVERAFSGPARVLGGAGTGKTVVAMHRARWLAEKVFTGAGDVILFTTFTVNLAADIESNLKRICSPDALKRIEVVNFDRWAKQFMDQQGYDYDLVYAQSRLEGFWRRAVDREGQELPFDWDFYHHEWKQVVMASDVENLSQYLRISRVGMGSRLSRRERMQVWKVFEAYRSILNEEKARDIDSLMMDARMILREKKVHLPYRAIIVDEGQDLSPQSYRLMRAIMGEPKPDDIFIVGDAHQRIYERKVSLKRCGIQIQGRSHILKINYRTPEQTRNWAFQILKEDTFDDLDDGIDTGKGYRSLFRGTSPQIRAFSTLEEEVEAIASQICAWIDQGVDPRDICLVARTKTILKDYKAMLSAKGVDVYSIKSEESEDRSRDCIRIATMHRVKGLEFAHMIIAGACDGVIPKESIYADVEDPQRRKDLEQAERSLLYVAATRARSSLLVTCWGKPSRWV